MARKPRTALKMAGAIAGVAFLFAAGCELQEGPPDNAEYIVDDGRRVYISPPCFDAAADAGDLEYVAAFQSSPRSVTHRELSALNYTPEPQCRRSAGFSGATYSPLRAVLVRSGLIGSPS